MVLAVPFHIAVNFTDPKFCKLKSWKSGEMYKILMYHFVPLKGFKTASHVSIKWKLSQVNYLLSNQFNFLAENFFADASKKFIKISFSGKFLKMFSWSLPAE